MCHFIAATLPSGIDVVRTAAVFKSHNLAFREFQNPHVSAQLPQDDHLVITASGHCDCGTPLGSAHHLDTSKDKDSSAAVTRLRRKGWSVAKIRRWLEEREKAHEKAERESASRVEHGTPQAKQWIEFISELLHSRLVPRVGLYLHMYSGQVYNEKVSFVAKHKVHLSSLSAELLLKIEEDHLYEFVP